MSSFRITRTTIMHQLRPISLFCVFYIMAVQANVLNRYIPEMSENRQQVMVGKRVKINIEMLAKYGASEKVVDVAKRAIIKHFTTVEISSGKEAHDIGTEMEKNFGGFWMVGVFDNQFDVAYTITRRSPRYMLFAAGDYNILIAEELTVGAKPSKTRPF